MLCKKKKNQNKILKGILIPRTLFTYAHELKLSLAGLKSWYGVHA